MTAARARGALVVVLATLLGAVALAVRGGARGATVPALERARQHFLAALEARARFDDVGMWEHLQAAWNADAGYLPAFRDPLQGVLSQQRYAELDSIAGAQHDATLGACLHVMVAMRRQGINISHATSPASPAGLACGADVEFQTHRRTRVDGDRLVLTRELNRRFPDSPYYLGHFLSVLGENGAWQTIVERAEEFAGPSHPALIRVEGFGYGAWALHRSGRHREAIEWEQRAEQETRRVTGVHLRFVELTLALHENVLREAEGDAAVVQHARAAIAALERERDSLLIEADLWTTLELQIKRAEQRLDQGELIASVHDWTELARIVDRLDEPHLQAQVRVRRGRALVKLGRTGEAEADLLAGRAAAIRAQSLHWQYEAEHNLLHLYEATGVAEQARQAGEAFVALTRAANEPAAHQMANHDLAWFHLRRGERERALQYFETVVLYSDSLPGFEYWAGEFFELTGNLERAERYFLRGRGVGDSRAYAGLARLAEATGDLDRAIRYGRAHDQAGADANYPESAPILPGVLARHGRLTEAEVEVSRARDDASRHGQVAAWATLSVELAELELHRGHAVRAAAIADSAQTEARRVAAVEASWRARGVAGLARSRMRGPESDRGLRDLKALVSEVNRTGQAQLLAQILAWYGEALSSTQQTTLALATLRQAAILTDSIAVSLSLDPARAGYRAAQIHISNNALETIIRHRGDRQSSAWFVDWSERRKSRGVVEHGPRSPGAPSLQSLRSQLAGDQAILDYVVLDSSVAVLVLTRERVALRHLPVPTETLQRRVASLLSQLVPHLGTKVDTAHAVLDDALAFQLYQDLLAPIEPDIGARRRLTIVADGPLHLLPFDALVTSRVPLEFVLDRFTVGLVPSLVTIAESQALRQSDTVVAVQGSGDLDGVDRELATVAEAWSARPALVLRGSEATEEAIRRYAPSAGLLHLAAHARPNDAEPAFAHLEFMAANGDDGLLHAYEIEQLRLPGTLVVLSACESNAGRLVGGEGVLSLSRAFLRAGARGTVSTLWPVGPATADFMAVFNRELSAGRAAVEALRTAKLGQRHGRWANPFHWAGFTIISREN